MCFHKTLVQEFASLQDYYSASFDTLTTELDHYRDKLHELTSRNNQSTPHTQSETEFLNWSNKLLSGLTPTGIRRYHENGFDYLPMPALTAGVPDKFKLFRWGLIPHFMTDRKKPTASAQARSIAYPKKCTRSPRLKTQSAIISVVLYRYRDFTSGNGSTVKARTRSHTTYSFKTNQ